MPKLFNYSVWSLQMSPKVVKHFFNLEQYDFFQVHLVYFFLLEPTDQPFSQRTLVHFNAELDIKSRLGYFWVFADVLGGLLPSFPLSGQILRN